MTVIGEGIQTNQEKMRQPSSNSKIHYGMVRKRQSIRAENMYLTNTLQSQNLHFIALLFYLITGALEWSTFSSGIDSKDSSFWDKLPQGLILRPKLAASSNTVSEKWRQQCFNSRFALHFGEDFTPPQKKKNHVFDCWDLVVEHIPNLWQHVCIACSLIFFFFYPSQRTKSSSLEHHWCKLTARLTGMQK